MVGECQQKRSLVYKSDCHMYVTIVVKDVVGKYISCFLARVRFSGGYVFCDRGSCSLCIKCFPYDERRRSLCKCVLAT